MLIELSTLTFTNQDDIVPLSQGGQILNTGVANTLAGNDTITGFEKGDNSDPDLEYGIVNLGTLNTGQDNDVITGYGSGVGSDWLLRSGFGGILIAEGSIFDTEDGDDRISGTSTFLYPPQTRTPYGISNYSFSFNTGDGNDTIEGTGYEAIYNKGFINTGNGKDIITANGGYYEYGGIGMRNLSTINTGNDDDRITGNGAIANSGRINTGDGNDSIIVTTPRIYFGSGLENSGVIETGEGNDIIYANSNVYDWDFFTGYNKGISNYGTINTGNGQDSISSVGTFYNRGGVFLGEGNDSITTWFSRQHRDGPDSAISNISNDGTINTGNGQDSIISRGNFTNRGGVFLGEGDDSITVLLAEDNINSPPSPTPALENFNAIETGDGDDKISSPGILYNEGIINTGNGNDSIEGVDIAGIGYGIYNNGGSINTGNGNDSIIANGGFESGSNSSGSVFLGEGEDYIKGFGSGDFYGGNGNDTLELTPGTYTVGIWDTSAIFTKGSQLMITSEFEKLKAGSTIYDFTSLTAGQIITIA